MCLHLCVDIDECTSDPDICDSNATCTNINGSFFCDCDRGFSGDGFTCIGITIFK